MDGLLILCFFLFIGLVYNFLDGRKKDKERQKIYDNLKNKTPPSLPKRRKSNNWDSL